MSEQDIERARILAEKARVRELNASTPKDTNPKDVLADSRAQTQLIPAEALLEVGLAMTEGANKYGAHNYTVCGARASVYLAAMKRHIAKFELGRDRDPDFDVHELAYAAACCLIVLSTQARGTLVDDRAPSIPDEQIGQLFADAQRRTAALQAKLQLAPGAKHWTRGMTK
jgi:hypothetical protein